MNLEHRKKSQKPKQNVKILARANPNRTNQLLHIVTSFRETRKKTTGQTRGTKPKPKVKRTLKNFPLKIYKKAPCCL